MDRVSTYPATTRTLTTDHNSTDFNYGLDEAVSEFRYQGNDENEKKLATALLNFAEKPGDFSSAIDTYSANQDMKLYKLQEAVEEAIAANPEAANGTELVADYEEKLVALDTTFRERLMSAYDEAQKSNAGLMREGIEHLRDMKENYVDVWAGIVQKYTKFYGDGVSALYTKISQKFRGVEDKGGSLNFNFEEFVKDIAASMEQFHRDPNNALYVSPSTGLEGLEQAQRWAKEMGYTSKDVIRAVQNSDGTLSYMVTVDPSILNNMYSATANAAFNHKDGKIGQVEFNAWLAPIDTQKERGQNGAQVFVEKFQRSNTTFNNMQTMVSAMLSSLLDLHSNVRRNF